MKKVMHPNGWDEVATKQIRVTGRMPRVFQTAGQWVDFARRYPDMANRGRHHCERCDIKWADLPPEAPTYLVTTSKYGNKVLCESCNNSIQPI